MHALLHEAAFQPVLLAELAGPDVPLIGTDHHSKFIPEKDQGWKTPFVLDPNILTHRLAMRRDAQRNGDGKDAEQQSKDGPK